MKRLFFMLIIGFFSLTVCSQTLSDLFYLLPDQFAYDLTINTRKELIKNKSAAQIIFNDDSTYFDLVSFDEKNGYVEFSSSHMESSWEMCYWKNSSGSILVGVSQPRDMSKKLFFFWIKDGKATYPTNDVLRGLSIYYFAKPNAKISDIDEELCGGLSYTLPRKGVNIICKIGWTCDEKTESFLLGDKCELLWEDGHFEFGKPYF